jgi:glycerol-3-phosphate acyltransferase PlsY
VGSLSAAVTLPAFAAFYKVGTAKTLLAFFAASVVTAEHIPNIKRLIAHTEPNFHLGEAK